jgi:hypothetical protein
LISQFLFKDEPSRILAERAAFALEHFGRILIAFELPFQPVDRDFPEFTAVGRPVGTYVAHAFPPGEEYGHMIDAFEVVLRVGILNSQCLFSGNEDRGSAELLQDALVVGGLQSAVPDPDRRDAWILRAYLRRYFLPVRLLVSEIAPRCQEAQHRKNLQIENGFPGSIDRESSLKASQIPRMHVPWNL